MSLLLALVSFFIFILPAIAPNPPGWEDSITYQNERVGIRCRGDFPGQLAHMLSPAFDPYHGSVLMGTTYNNLVAICARADWGGRPVNVNGVCSALTPHPNTLIFDKGFSAIPSISAIFAMLYCSTKCYCTAGLNGGSASTTNLPRIQNTLPQYRIFYIIDEYSGEVIMVPDFSPALGELRYYMTIPTIQRVGLETASSYAVMVTGPPSRRLACEGAVPSLNFIPGNDIFYTDLLSVCAGSIYGGNDLGNMGGVCESFMGGSPLLTFSSMLRHPDAVGPDAARIQLYCAAKCRCFEGSVEDTGTFMSEDNGVILVKNIGNKQYEATDGQGRTARFVAVLKEGNRVDLGTVDSPGSSYSVTYCKGSLLDLAKCSDPSGTLCKPSNPIEVTTATSLPDPVDTIHKSPHRSSEPATCPNRACTSSRDCSGCKCKVSPKTVQLQASGSGQSTFSKARCGHVLSFAAMMALSAGVEKGRGGGRGGGTTPGKRRRDVEWTEGRGAVDEGLEMLCACNGSYVSHGCCGADDGMVWEAPGLKLGILV